jgi:isohexenylglutaconyl-CoA hydratase
MSFGTLTVARSGWRLDVTLNRPESRNAMNAAMVRELSAIFAAPDPQVRAIVLRGAGGSFCAGGDLKGMDGGSIRDVNRSFGAMLEQAEVLPALLVAVVEGPAMGGGLGLACVADVTIAAPDARFSMPEVRLGLIPAQIAPFVVRRIGQAAARRLALTGASLGAEEALRLGLASAVGDVDALLEATLADLARCAPRAVAATKRLIARAEGAELDVLLDEAADQFAEALSGDEARAGIAAFLTRSAPPWAGP